MTALSVVDLPRQGRVSRRPEHTFHVRYRPFQIQPVMIAPVLPGETLKQAQFQMRAVADPIRNPLVGWWSSWMMFYVPFRALPDAASAAMQNLMLQPDANINALDTAASVPTYHARATLPDFTMLCLDAVVKEFFTDEGDVPPTLGGLPMAKLRWRNYLDSLGLESAYPVGGDPDTAADMGELDAMYQRWQQLRLAHLTDMTYEDYLRTFGVRRARIRQNKPELLRMVEDWQYPNNTVDPTTGAPSSSVGWSLAERADKDRFFMEPGFVFSVLFSRPKMYAKNLIEAGVNLLDQTNNWLPAVLHEEVYSSLKVLANASSPIRAQSAEMLLDIRDLFLYGDQFVNFDTSAATDVPLASVPNAATGAWKYAQETDIDALFVDVTAGPTGRRYIRADGVHRLVIAGAQRDHTPGTMRPIV